MALTEEQRAELAKQVEVELRAGLEMMGKENNPRTPSPNRLTKREIGNGRSQPNPTYFYLNFSFVA